MSKLTVNYDVLMKKLDSFIRKYYVNKIIRGTIYFFALVLAMFLVFNLLEDQFFFSKSIRKGIFYSFILMSIAGLAYWVLLPIAKYFQLGETISQEKAAKIIGEHFTDVKDKLLNILQLRKQADSVEDNQLLYAGIDQKSDEIKLVPFKSAINLKKNKKYLKYLAVPFFVLVLILLFYPNKIKSSTNRIINNNEDFERPAPFHFKVLNKDLRLVQYEDINIEVEVEGESIPKDIFIDVDNFQYRLKKKADNLFEYSFVNVQNQKEFRFYSGNVYSKNYKLDVVPKPIVSDFTVNIDYPAYTRQKDEKLENIGDLIVLEGSKVSWQFKTKNTDSLNLKFGSDKQRYFAEKIKDAEFGFTKSIKSDDYYKIFIKSDKIDTPDSVSYSISVIKDKYPEISVEQIKDSTENTFEYFIGTVSDDYGFSKLTFNYEVFDVSGMKVRKSSDVIQLLKSRETNFKYPLDFEKLELKPGEFIKCYFEIFDNDRINGAKSARTREFEFSKQTDEEFEEEENKNEENIKDNLSKIMKESKKIQEEIKKLREKLLQKKDTEWQDKKEFEKLLEKQKELRKLLDEAKKKLEENLKKQEEHKKLGDDILEKQEKIQKMFEESLSKEQQDLLEKIQEMMQDINKDQMLEEMEELDMSEEKIEKQMDRMLELFKQLEMEKEMQETIDKLNELAEKQEKLSEETKKEEKNNEELKKEQEELSKEFEKQEEKLKDLMEKNKELETPKNLAEDNEEKMEEIKQDMEDSEEKLENNSPDDASQKQKNAAQKMKNMASSLQMQMQGSSEEQQEEDEKALRQLLENILSLSFDQELLMDKTDGVIVNSPAYKSALRDQHRIKEDFKIVEDSLHELSKRVVQIETFVTEKVAEVKSSINSSLKKLEEDGSRPGHRDIQGSIKSQHESMKGLNDLALMLDEAMQQMQQNASGVPGSGSCNKPGGKGKGKSEGKKSGGSSPTDKIVKGQKKLGEQLQNMMKQMNGKGKKGGMAKEFAEAAKRQAQMRKALEEIKRQRQEEGKGQGNELQKMIDDMNKIEEDLVNKRLDSKLIERQKEITSRLLEAEKSDRQREYDNKRKSQSAVDLEKKLPPAIEKYLKERESQLDMYKTISPSLKPFYRKLVNDYLKNVKKK